MAIGLIIFAIFGLYRVFHRENINVVPELAHSEQIENVAAKDNITLGKNQTQDVLQDIKTTKPSGAVYTTINNLKKTAQQEQGKNKSDFAPIVGNTEGVATDTPVELKQYHVYAAPRVLREAGIKLDFEHSEKIRGASYGIKKRITEKGQYIGVRLEYDWKDKETSVWATYSW